MAEIAETRAELKKAEILRQHAHACYGPWRLSVRMTSTNFIPDSAIAAFLKSKGVNIEAPRPASRLGSGINGLITGTAGPLVGAAGFALSAQEKNHRLQEWTSWKQWAIGHSGWPQFWETNREELLKQDEKVTEASEAQLMKDKSTLKLVGLILFGMATWGVGPAIYVWRKHGTRWPVFLLLGLGAGMIGVVILLSEVQKNAPSYNHESGADKVSPGI